MSITKHSIMMCRVCTVNEKDLGLCCVWLCVYYVWLCVYYVWLYVLCVEFYFEDKAGNTAEICQFKQENNETGVMEYCIRMKWGPFPDQHRPHNSIITSESNKPLSVGGPCSYPIVNSIQYNIVIIIYTPSHKVKPVYNLHQWFSKRFR